MPFLSLSSILALILRRIYLSSEQRRERKRGKEEYEALTEKTNLMEKQARKSGRRGENEKNKNTFFRVQEFVQEESTKKRKKQREKEKKKTKAKMFGRRRSADKADVPAPPETPLPSMYGGSVPLALLRSSATGGRYGEAGNGRVFFFLLNKKQCASRSLSCSFSFFLFQGTGHRMCLACCPISATFSSFSSPRTPELRAQRCRRLKEHLRTSKDDKNAHSEASVSERKGVQKRRKRNFFFFSFFLR